jgi:hypothetical protein
VQYLLIISHDNTFVPTKALITSIYKWINKMSESGIRVYGNPLQPPENAVTIRVREGNAQIKNGPFSNAKEKMCAYELIECGSFEEAVDVAAHHPMAKVATIEVRPVWQELAN